MLTIRATFFVAFVTPRPCGFPVDCLKGCQLPLASDRGLGILCLFLTRVGAMPFLVYPPQRSHISQFVLWLLPAIISKRTEFNHYYRYLRVDLRFFHQNLRSKRPLCNLLYGNTVISYTLHTRRVH